MFARVFNKVKGMFGTAQSPAKAYHSVSAELVHEYAVQRAPDKRKVLCYAPFTNLYFGRQGNVLSCCHNRKHIIGTYPQQTIAEIWNGSKLKELRDYVQNNDLTSGCHVCKWDLEQRSFGDVKALHFDSLPVLEHFPTMMEFELDNTCNLECSMCSGEFSSSIRKNRDHKPPIQSVYDADFADQLDPFIPHIETARFSGGEPFLIDIYYTIWEKFVTLNPDCLLSVQTNGTVLNNRVKNVLERGRFEIGISLDGLQASTFEGIRVNARFDKVMENLEYFADYCRRKNTSFRISVCAMRENWEEIPHYIAFCQKYGAYLQIHNVWFPPASALWNLDPDKLEKIHDYLLSFRFEKDSVMQRQNVRHYDSFTAQVGSWLVKARETAAASVVQEKTYKQQLFDKIAAHIEADAALSPEEMAAKIAGTIGKAESVWLRFDDAEIELASEKMLEVPIELLVSSLHFENEERIYDQAAAFLRA